MNEKETDSSENESVKKEDKEEEGTKKRKGGHIKMIARKKARKQSDIDSDDEHKKCLKIVIFENGDYLVIYRANGNFRAFNYLMEVLHIFDRQDLFHLYDLIRDQFSEVTLDGFELILWGDLKIMMESSTEGNEQKDACDLVWKLESESSVALDLIRFIKQQIDDRMMDIENGVCLVWLKRYDGVLSDMSLVKGLKDYVLAMALTFVKERRKLYLLHMDLCGPMCVASVNRKKYILVIVDDYSLFTWVKCLSSKDEAPDFIIKFFKMIQVRLKVLVRRIRTDNGTEFVNQTLREYYEKVDISYETSIAHSPHQNGVVERRNRTLIKVSRTMLIYAKALLFLWAETVATACYTKNRSIVCLCHGKTPYELLHDKPPDLSFFHVFGALCYPTNDSENLGKLQPKADIGIFIGYAPTKKAFRIYNRRTRRIIKTIHVDFNELTTMASEHSSLGPALHEMTPATISSGLVPNPPP
ncbi:retrovirus-related pol polyprotein from transposon TNT 1-94 [Tanacetum coccineum]|uniref:Retrovirus-related pol polyprotein from transposon TNT 1-94 n=1 Tax=Tanacetum coccineum TaxID=301880 RepID=A0ABQ5I4G9_9ASTR